MSFGYDINGNLTASGTTTYAYDAENQLISSSTGASLQYDPLGRLWQTSGGANGNTQFLYDGEHVVAEYDGANGSMRRRYMWGPGADEPIMVDEGGMNCSTTRFFHPDERGSIVALADCNGVRTQVNSYDEHGVPDTTNAPVQAGGRFGYTGQMWVPELGLWYYKARMYSPTLGRFMQTDPIGYADGMNLYNYVGGDAINSIDPDGLRCVGANLSADLSQEDCVNNGGTWEVVVTANLAIGGVVRLFGLSGGNSGGLGHQTNVPKASDVPDVVVVANIAKSRRGKRGVARGGTGNDPLYSRDIKDREAFEKLRDQMIGEAPNKKARNKIKAKARTIGKLRGFYPTGYALAMFMLYDVVACYTSASPSDCADWIPPDANHED